MRILSSLVAVALCLAVSGTSPAADPIWPKLKVDKTGEFKDEKGKKFLDARIVQLVAVEMMLVKIGDDPAFLVKGLNVKEYADDSIIELRGEWKVTGTGPFGGKTYFIVEPVKDAMNKASFAIAGADKAPGIWQKMKVGKTGEFKDPKTKKLLSAKVKELISDKLMLVEVSKGEPPFIVRGLPTKGLADDIEIELPGEWKVVGVGPYQLKNYYIVEEVMKKK